MVSRISPSLVHTVIPHAKKDRLSKHITDGNVKPSAITTPLSVIYTYNRRWRDNRRIVGLMAERFFSVVYKELIPDR
jgi:hypothetical protein